MNKPWLQILSPLENLIQWEIFIIILFLAFLTRVFQKVFFKNISEDRHRNLSIRFNNLTKQLMSLVFLTLLFFALDSLKETKIIYRILPYIGLSAVIAGCVTFIQICRIMLLQYLFLTSDKTAVPILLVNIFTLIMSLFVGGWVVTAIFGIKVAPLLATSAVFSIILGLALQDTLGNLFAGISLQIDRTFEIGDWVEVQQGSQKIHGQVMEMTWRSTVLVGLLDEVISIPNRFIAQSQINNWTRKGTPIARTQNFRIPYAVNIEKAIQVFNHALSEVEGIRKNPKPLTLVFESTESWVLVKVIYYIDDYGKYATVGDRVIRKCLYHLHKEGVPVAAPQLELVSASSNRP